MSTTATWSVTGMTCEHCERAVLAEVGALDGVRSVEVALVPSGTSAVTTTSDAPLDEAAVAAALGEAGYALERP